MPVTATTVPASAGESRKTPSAAPVYQTDYLMPVEVHVFARDGQHYAFDCRSYAIFKLDRGAALVLDRAARMSLPEIVEDLAGELSEAEIRGHYLRFLEMLVAGELSCEPVPRPGRPPFKNLVLMLAGGCNMGCSYCFEKDVPIYQKPNVMTRERADEVLEWFFRHQEGPKAHVQLYGGEPLLNWEVLTHVVERIDAWAAREGKDLSKYLITNGTLLNEERVGFLVDHGVTVQVSVDGDRRTHDRFRTFKNGRPTMPAILPNIKRLAEKGADFNLRAVLTRANKDPDAVTRGLSALGGERVSFEVVATDAREAQFDEADWEEFLAHYDRYLGRAFETWTGLPDEMKGTILKILRQQRVVYGCGAGVSEVTVAPDGNIYECQRIYRDPYSSIAEDKGPTELDSRFLTMVDDRPVCQDCWARYLCGGGCMHQSQTGHGSDDPLPQYCRMKHALVEAAIVRIDEIRSIAARAVEA